MELMSEYRYDVYVGENGDFITFQDLETNVEISIELHYDDPQAELRKLLQSVYDKGFDNGYDAGRATELR